MKKIILILIISNLFYITKAEEIYPDSMSVTLARMFSKDIFELNGVPYLQPVVEVVNSTSNTRFYNEAFVPSEENKFYVKFGIHGMFGIVPDSKKVYSPKVPNEEFTTDGLGLNTSTGEFKYGKIKYDISNPSNTELIIKDTVGLLYYALKGMFYNGLKDGSLKIPSESPTALGHGKQNLELPDTVLIKLFNELSINLPIIGQTKLSDYIPDSLKNQIYDIFRGFPSYFTLPEGSNLNYIFAAVPQFEFGSFYGTELLIRFIPPINMGETIGDFAFWAFGLKHSISQYFNPSDDPELRLFDMSIQAVYQGTSLKNKIGVTNADLTANANMFNLNLNFSKTIPNIFDIYSGFAYQSIKIKSKYKYYLPIEVQWQLGLIDKGSDDNPNYKPTPGHPGDQNPQTANVELSDKAIAWNIGISKKLGPVNIFIDYNIAKINIISAGIVYNFNNF